LQALDHLALRGKFFAELFVYLFMQTLFVFFVHLFSLLFSVLPDLPASAKKRERGPAVCIFVSFP